MWRPDRMLFPSILEEFLSLIPNLGICDANTSELLALLLDETDNHDEIMLDYIGELRARRKKQCVATQLNLRQLGTGLLAASLRYLSRSGIYDDYASCLF